MLNLYDFQLNSQFLSTQDEVEAQVVDLSQDLSNGTQSTPEDVAGMGCWRPPQEPHLRA